MSSRVATPPIDSSIRGAEAAVLGVYEKRRSVTSLAIWHVVSRAPSKYAFVSLDRATPLGAILASRGAYLTRQDAIVSSEDACLTRQDAIVASRDACLTRQDAIVSSWGCRAPREDEVRTGDGVCPGREGLVRRCEGRAPASA
ncbi:MAG: hypothetical protein ACREJ3_11865 [Polyangiaceae bacterium]